MMPDQLIPVDVTFLSEPCKLLIINGERGRNRTFNLLIKSQLLCQLSYAPACKGRLLKCVLIIASKNRAQAGRTDAAPRARHRSNRYSICTNCPWSSVAGGGCFFCGARQKSMKET